MLHAAEKVRDAGFRKWDVFTPVPRARHGQGDGHEELEGRLVRVHWRGGRLHHRDVDDLVDERLSTIPIVIGGKPMFSPFCRLPALLRTDDSLWRFRGLFGMLFLNRLPRLHHPLLKNKRFSLVTHDRFFVVIECADPKYSETETRKLLEEAGSQHIEWVED